MMTIANDKALQQVTANKAVLIDVRETAEFWEGHMPGAINLPSTQFALADYQAFLPRPIYLICNPGRRVQQIAALLPEQQFPHVYMLEHQMDMLNEAHQANQPLPLTPPDWTIDRQFRMTLGMLLLIFLLGYVLWSVWFLVIPVILCTGLIITSILDRCYMRMGIAMLPWNKKRAQKTAAEATPLPSYK